MRPPGQYRAPVFSLLFLWVSVSVSGCVYYNTFYNARKLFKDAERSRLEAEASPSDARRAQAAYFNLYYSAITKASIVLDLHPTSKWVDDSLLLIGKAYYWREEYDEALLKFRELQKNFPESPLVEESVYWEGLALRAKGRIDEAREVLQAFGTAPGSRFSKQARIVLAEIEAEAGNDERAVAAYRDFLSQAGKTDLKARAWKGLGDAYRRLGRYDSAVAAYQRVLSAGASPLLDFESRIQIGTILELQGKLPEALQTYSGIVEVKRLRPYEPQVRLKQANVYRLMGRLDMAQEIYEGVIRDYPRTDFSADAYYRMGIIEQRHRRDLDRAREFFDKARREKGNSEAALLARQRQNDLKDLERYRRTAEKGGKKGLEALFSLAELYLFRFSEIDSALATYQKALELGGDTAYAPKALYAIGLIYADSLKNAGAAQGVFQRLIDTYPQTSYAELARTRTQHQRADDALAEARFLEAEALRRKGEKLEEVLTLLKQVALEYPQSFYAPKALYTAAWLYENERQDLDTARAYYRQLVDRYPITHFAEVAKEKLEGGFLNPPEEKAASVDSAGVQTAAQPSPLPLSRQGMQKPLSSVQPKRMPKPPAAGKDTVLEFDEVDWKPQAVESPAPEYPDEARDERTEGTVVVGILIGKDGRVKKAEAISGPEVFHTAAVNAAYHYRFKPGRHKGVVCEVRMEIPIHFKPPD